MDLRLPHLFIWRGSLFFTSVVLVCKGVVFT